MADVFCYESFVHRAYDLYRVFAVGPLRLKGDAASMIKRKKDGFWCADPTVWLEGYNYYIILVSIATVPKHYST